jgi:hypothetical protein
MNAFKKELAGILLGDADGNRCMEKIIHDMNDVFSVYSQQKDCMDGLTAWFGFLSMLTMHMIGRIGTVINDNLEPTEEDKLIIRLVIAIEKVTGSCFGEMLLDTNEKIEKLYLEELKK